MKRKSDGIGVLSCPAKATECHISMPCTKKLRRYVSGESQSSKVRWKAVLEDHSDSDSLSSDEESKERITETSTSSVTESKTWYSKEQYKQMLLDQSLTVHIMRSLRSLAGEKVSIDYCDKIDSDTSRFDELIKKHQIDPEEYCERGLETYLSDERRNEVNATRKLHKLLVIAEYARQGIAGTSDPELIRNISINQSNKSLVRAQKLALFDERESLSAMKIPINRKIETQQQHSKKENMKPEIKLDCLISGTPSSPVLGSKTMGGNADPRRWNLFSDSMKRSPPNSTRLVSEGLQGDLRKEQMIRFFLVEQERERIQSQRHRMYGSLNSFIIPDESSPHISNSILAALQIQEVDRLVHQLQHEEQHRQRLEIQRNYETHQLRQLLLLQQQQQQQQQQQRHYESVRLATADFLGQQYLR